MVDGWRSAPWIWRYDAVDDIDRQGVCHRFSLIGTPGRETIDFNSLRKAGVEIVGRLAGGA